MLGRFSQDSTCHGVAEKGSLPILERANWGVRAMPIVNASWMPAAECRTVDARLFFSPGDKETREERLDREVQAKDVCKRCPVQNECLDYAIRNRERQGIWGGLNEAERTALFAR